MDDGLQLLEFSSDSDGIRSERKTVGATLIVIMDGCVYHSHFKVAVRKWLHYCYVEPYNMSKNCLYNMKNTSHGPKCFPRAEYAPPLQCRIKVLAFCYGKFSRICSCRPALSLSLSLSRTPQNLFLFSTTTTEPVTAIFALPSGGLVSCFRVSGR